MKKAKRFLGFPGVGVWSFAGPMIPRNDVISGMDSMIEKDAGMNPGDIVRKPLLGTDSEKGNAA